MATKAQKKHLEGLARRTLWIAYVWNDHNFDDDIRKYARETAEECGIKSIEDANTFLTEFSKLT